MTEKKWNFDHILGHEHAISGLKAMLKSGKFPHAILFTGPSGVGKHTTARSFAMSVNCLDPNQSPCFTCRNCQRFSHGNYPDFMETIPESTGIKIDQIKEGCKILTYPPAEKGLRIWIIVDAHQLRIEAANALLKVLEEPPPRNLLILTAVEGDTLLNTITSRCMKLPFYSLSNAVTATILQEKLNIDKDQALQTAMMSGGSPGKAMEMDTEALEPFKSCIIKLFSSKHQWQASEILDMAQSLAKASDHLLNILEWGKLLCRDILLMQGPVDRELIATYDTVVSMGSSINRLTQTFILRAFDALNDAQMALTDNANPQLVLESLFMRITDRIS